MILIVGSCRLHCDVGFRRNCVVGNICTSANPFTFPRRANRGGGLATMMHRPSTPPDGTWLALANIEHRAEEVLPLKSVQPRRLVIEGASWLSSRWGSAQL
jgi:hypothetical protein